MVVVQFVNAFLLYHCLKRGCLYFKIMIIISSNDDNNKNNVGNENYHNNDKGQLMYTYFCSYVCMGIYSL